jgi:two-component system sensor histidine kinase HydH
MLATLKKRFNKLSLSRKFSAAVIINIGLMMIVVNWLVISHQRGALKAEMEGSHRVVVKNLSTDATEPLILMDPLRLDDLVRTIRQTPGCVYAGVLDSQGRIVAHTERKLLGSVAAPLLTQADAGGMQKRDEFVRDSAAEGIKEIYVPVAVGYERVGTVFAGFSREGSDAVIETNVRRLKKYIIFVSAIIIAVGICGAFLLARLLTTPMKKLKQQMERVQAGDLNVTVPNENLLNCWEILGCAYTQCAGYGKERCWTIENTRCWGCTHGTTAEKLHDCKKCIVYRESCGDEVGELIEVFNQMVGDLRKNLAALDEVKQEKFRLDRLSAIGQIAAGVAHEINNPLGGISLCFNNLMKTKMDEETRRQHIEVINSGFDRIQSTVKRLLDFAKNSSLNMARLPVNSVVKSVVKLAEYTVAKQGCRLVEKLAQSDPEVVADSAKLEQVFLNLIINAVQAMNGTGVLTVETAQSDLECLVSISDTGPGIPRDILPRIFDPFFTTKGPREGTGLGLSVSKAIVEQHKGEISVATSPKGATFTVHLPITDRL